MPLARLVMSWQQLLHCLASSVVPFLLWLSWRKGGR